MEPEWSTWDLLPLSVKRHMQQSKSEKGYQGFKPLGTKVWVTDQLPRPAKMIIGNEEQLEWIVEGKEDGYQLWPEINYSYKVY